MTPTLDHIRSRVSIRSYNPVPLGETDTIALRQTLLESVPGPFGGHPRFVLIDSASVALKRRKIIGTYGVIRNAPAFVVGALRPGVFAFVDYGYCMEGIILAATGLGLGTCWLGGIFDRGAAARVLELEENEVVPAATPVGRGAPGRRTMMERIIRGSAGSSSRKPFGELFFDGGFDRPLEPDGAGPWAEVLECVRIGPSASNKQPWRIVRTEGPSRPAFHLYLKENHAYSRAVPGVLLQDLDMGIAMRHFEAAARALGLSGRWSRADPDPVLSDPPLRYIASWTDPH